MSLFLASTNAVSQLAKVKAGLDESGSLPDGFWLYFLGGLAFFIALSLVVSWLRFRGRRSLLDQWTSLSDARRIAKILQRAAATEAHCSVEVFDARHKHIYRGQVCQAEPGRSLSIELDETPDYDVDFTELPAQVHLNFRPKPKEKMEHYQFSIQTLGLSWQRRRQWRVARLNISWPKSLIVYQRRDFVRIEPEGLHSLSADLLPLPRKPQAALEELPRLAQGRILDISTGGLQMLVPGPADLFPDSHYLLDLTLPLTDLGLQLAKPRLWLEIVLLARETIKQHSDSEKAPESDFTLIRGRFISRCHFDDKGQWKMLDFSLNSFQDLTSWLYAYQRYQLNREKGLESRPEARLNIFPSRPPR